MYDESLKGKRVLLTHPFLYEINGATNVTLELAKYLQDSQAKVRLYTNVFEKPVKQFFEKSGIKVDVAANHPKYHLKDFDYIWINSQTFPVSLLKELGERPKMTDLPTMIFMHMSAHEDCADEMPYIYKFEENLSSLSLFVSEEAFRVCKRFFEVLPPHNYYRNPAPVAYSLIDKQFKDLRNILIVSNHPCQEILDIREPLRQKGITVDCLGITGDQYTMINEQIISKYDAIISIGKTVQYCLVSGTPVYIYDVFGGPGWLTDDNYSKAREKNFSGRGFNTKKPEKIVHEIISGYEAAIKYHSDNKSRFQKEYLISYIIPNIFQQAEKQKKKITPLTKANIASHQSLLRLVEIDFNKWFQVFSTKSIQQDYSSLQHNNLLLQEKYDELVRERNSLYDQNRSLSSIVESRSVKTWLNFNKSIRKIKSIPKYVSQKLIKPEIIAVLCVHNEELNIDGCINHIEPYVDKIVILDDRSTDDTAKIAAKHSKVAKIITIKNSNSWQERKNRSTVLREAYALSKKSNPWALCIDADERFELPFLQNLRKIATKYRHEPTVIWVHFRELWDDIWHYRIDGIWGEKKKDVFFPLSKRMTFNYNQEHHIPWHYRELDGNNLMTDYNLYHLKMIKASDRKKRADLYNKLDPEHKMQAIGYDYLTDTSNLSLAKISKKHSFDQLTIPDYYKKH